MNLYTATIPPYITSLRNLHAILEKAEAHAAEQQIPESYYLSHRLFPDMYHLAPHIQRCSDISRGVAVRIAGQEHVAMSDSETTFTDLKRRLLDTISVLERVKESDMANKDDHAVEIYFKLKDWTWKASALDYVNRYALPNFYFHLTAAYCLLRACGVPLGKDDYLGEA